MNKATIRSLLKWSFLVNTAFLVLIVIDYVALDSGAMLVLLPLHALLVVGLIVLFVIEEKPHYRRIRFHDRPEPPKTVVYGRR